ncbi:hypothetical protein AWH56_000100 [Anaerobacillus isosaccharinicus]|uniref:Resolvase HTH domain-containing protein n=1 Tax=Anaerobacillus isosaccharinicus TaxID=1532552 RepID=A0A1S2LR03_9BACI|nr:hypothetical protein [Anaerobacillus isosaccharinicus]MBA5585545.1 hypothetical protein [Anaerobacillus isosaccharinicus]QOY36141.1 hypothetical protein AWH56_000100 [Anaerobacillus isosaccharinicus]
MEYTIIALFSLSILLFIVSFVKKDRNKEVETQIENFSITLMQEIYQLKKKIKILEEEILIGQDDRYFTNSQDRMLTYDRDKILALYEDGHSLEEIEEITGLSIEKIQEILG